MAWTTPSGCCDSSNPGPRAAHSCDVIGHRMFVFGGWNGKKGLNDVYMFDTLTEQWMQPETTGSIPSARNNHATFVIGSKIYVHGGHDGAHWLSDLYCLETDCNPVRWECVAVSGRKPSARACHTTNVVEDQVIMFGGFDGVRCFNDIDVLDINTFAWRRARATGSIPQPRNAHTMTIVGHDLVLCGGHSGSAHLCDLFVLDSATFIWTAVELRGAIPPGLRGHTATLIGHKILMFGGYDGRGRSNELYMLDSKTMEWEHVTELEGVPPGRQRHTACLIRSHYVYFFGGFDGHQWLNDLCILDFAQAKTLALNRTAADDLVNSLRSMVNNPQSLPDVVFIVEDKEAFAHKAILIARCPHFAAMFRSGMRESNQTKIEFPGWSYPAFVAMLEYIYTARVSDLDPSLALELLSLADHNELTNLKALCETVLVHHIDTSNAAVMLLEATKSMASELVSESTEFILQHADEIDFEPLRGEPHLLIELTRRSMSMARALRRGSPKPKHTAA